MSPGDCPPSHNLIGAQMFKPNGKRLYEMKVSELSKLADEAHESGNDYWETLYREQISLNHRIGEAFKRQCSAGDAGAEP